jgi:hypothetical protein
MRSMVAATVLLCATMAAPALQAQVLDRVIEEDIRVRLPLLPCTVPGVAIRIENRFRFRSVSSSCPNRAENQARTLPNAKMKSSLPG